MISAVINSLEKIFNMLVWADSKRSIYIFMILLFVVLVAEPYIFQIIGTIFCIHRLFKGLNFYEKKHYSSNRKLAVYCLRYIMNLHFSALITNKDKKIKTIQQAEIELEFQEMYFPIKDEEKSKKLKLELEHVLGVYIDLETLEKGEKKGAVLLIHLVSIIESCEARLKLEWVEGQEGICN